MYLQVLLLCLLNMNLAYYYMLILMRKVMLFISQYKKNPMSKSIYFTSVEVYISILLYSYMIKVNYIFSETHSILLNRRPYSIERKKEKIRKIHSK